MRPFWTYFGRKWRIAPRYPKPLYSRIVEPFAGAAGYSLRYPSHDVVLIEKNPMIADMWRWLISAPVRDVLELPRLPESGRIDDVEWPCEAARNLAGFWITRGATHPNRVASAWMRDPRYALWSWGEHAVCRIASQVERIRHWTIIQADYADAPREAATWFVDPPYIAQGDRYRYGAKDVDFERLGQWCRGLPGQAIVCEQAGADWLPFEFFHLAKANESVSGGKSSAEVVWYGGKTPERQAALFAIRGTDGVANYAPGL